MKKTFDQEIRESIQKENISVPPQIHLQTEQFLASLPENKNTKIIPFPSRTTRKVAVAVACFFFVTLFFLPNVSVVYAKAMENIPIIGKLVEVLTIRNYFYSDGRHELDAEIPSVNDSSASNASELINMNVNELTSEIIQKFYAELEITENQGYGSIYIDYETITNTDQWFTLKLTVTEVTGSSNVCHVFYHIDRTKGKYVQFGDFIAKENFDTIEQIIIKQMKAQMAANANITYWVDSYELGESITSLDVNQNFYFNENGDFVIVYNKYEVAPGSMGCPEFTISKEEIAPYLIYSLK